MVCVHVRVYVCVCACACACVCVCVCVCVLFSTDDSGAGWISGQGTHIQCTCMTPLLSNAQHTLHVISIRDKKNFLSTQRAH